MPKRVSKKCIDEALSGLKSLNARELKDYVNSVFVRARELGDPDNMKIFDQAMKEVNKSKEISYFEAANIKAENANKFNRAKNKILSNKKNVRSILLNRWSNDMGDSVVAAKRSAFGKLNQFWYKDSTYEEEDYANNSDNQWSIADAFDGRSIENPFAKKIADKLKKYFEFRNDNLIDSGAMTEEQIAEDRMFRAIHDSSRIISGGQSLVSSAKNYFMKKYNTANSKAAWKDKIKKHIDLEKTFRYTKAMNLDGTLNISEVDKILDNIYDNITTGKSDIFTRSAVVNDAEAVAKKSRMFFRWNSMRDLLEYNKVYGKGDLMSALNADMRASGNKIGIAEKLGDSPYTMYNELRKVQEKVTPDRFMKGWWWDNTDLYFRSAMGLDAASKSPAASQMVANLNTLTSMARTFKLALTSTSDIAYISSFAQRMGINYFKAYSDLTTNIFNKYPSEDRKYIAQLFKGMVKSHLGYMGRWVEANNSSEFLNKISTKYFKAIQLNAFDEGNKVGIMTLMSKHLFENSSKKFGDINDQTRKWISKFLDEKEWDTLRKNNKGSLFTTDNVETLDDEALKKLHSKSGFNGSAAQYKNELYRKVYSMFDVASENAVLSPSEFEQAWCYRGTSPGTLSGSFLRIVSQFKMYSLSYIDRVLVNGWKDADTAQQKIMWATSMLMGTLPLSLMTVYLDNLSNGLSMPDISLMNVPDRTKYLINLLAPSLSIFSGILDPRNQNSDMVWSLLGSPSTRLIGNSMASVTSLLEGNFNQTSKHLKAALNYMVPIQNIPGVSPYIRQAMGTEAYLEPGQTHLYGR